MKMNKRGEVTRIVHTSVEEYEDRPPIGRRRPLGGEYSYGAVGQRHVSDVPHLQRFR